MQIDPVSNPPPPQPSGNAGLQDAASNAFGLSFESLLRIILTQLTYQDPLKPMDNFEFVSQLAQFSQLQIGQTANDRLQLLVSAQGNSQAAGLLGRIVDLPTNTGFPVSGRVTAISFANGEPRVTIETADDQTINNIALGAIARIREGD
jgi:flagellar basal-body rod modification protein FlgD